MTSSLLSSTSRVEWSTCSFGSHTTASYSAVKWSGFMTPLLVDTRMLMESDHPTTHTTCSLAWADPAVKNGEKQKGGGGKEEGCGD